MYSVYKLGLTTALCASSAMFVAPDAHATDANHSGTICKNYNAGQALDIDYLPNGTRNSNAGARYVICPIVRAPTANNSASVWVGGTHSNNTVSTSCTLYSYGFLPNTLRGFASFTVSATAGDWERFLSLPVANYWDNLSLLCYIPGSYAGVITGIDVVQ
ncbi:hypothetical protein AAKU55_005356 [Oxalobacteraceae bacterium GrIS 1.11]